MIAQLSCDVDDLFNARYKTESDIYFNYEKTPPMTIKRVASKLYVSWIGAHHFDKNGTRSTFVKKILSAIIKNYLYLESLSNIITPELWLSLNITEKLQGSRTEWHQFQLATCFIYHERIFAVWNFPLWFLTMKNSYFV